MQHDKEDEETQRRQADFEDTQAAVHEALDKYRRDTSRHYRVMKRVIATGLTVSILGIGVFMLRGPGPPPHETFPYGPEPKVQVLKRIHAPQREVEEVYTLQEYAIRPYDQGIETALYVGEGWDYVLAWDGPNDTRGVLNYDGTVQFLASDSRDYELRGLYIESLEDSP